jgi:aldehyde dehydrogenase (NAD+)
LNQILKPNARDSRDVLLDAVAPYLDKPGSVGSLINGGICTGEGAQIELFDPCTGSSFISIQDAGVPLVQKACVVAEEGSRAWRSFTASERGRILYRVASLVRRDQEQLAVIEALNVGKPIGDARAEVLKVAEMFEYYSGWADKIHGDVIPVPTSHFNHTLKQPYGVVLVITPWNAPLFVAGWNVAPALAAGNSILLKPSEHTPFTSIALGRLLIEAGVPKSAVGVLIGLGQTTGAAAVKHAIVRKVTFVGSPETGRRIATLCAEGLKGSVLELGGKSANIMFADSDLDKAVGGAAAAIFSNAGQSCVAGSRLLVQSTCYDEVVERLASLTSRIVVGHPLSAGSQVGPIQNRRQFELVDRMVSRAKARGATVFAGGSRSPLFDTGYFFAPTVLGNIRNSDEIAQDEIFGPVVAVIPFADEDDAIAIANDTKFGLAGAVWTKDVGRAIRVARSIDAGTVWVNSYKSINVMTPFGGFKESGYGRSSGRDGLEEYLQTKSVWFESAKEPVFSFGYG